MIPEMTAEGLSSVGRINAFKCEYYAWSEANDFKKPAAAGRKRTNGFRKKSGFLLPGCI